MQSAPVASSHGLAVEPLPNQRLQRDLPSLRLAGPTSPVSGRAAKRGWYRARGPVLIWRGRESSRSFAGDGILWCRGGEW